MISTLIWMINVYQFFISSFYHFLTCIGTYLKYFIVINNHFRTPINKLRIFYSPYSLNLLFFISIWIHLLFLINFQILLLNILTPRIFALTLDSFH